MGVWKRKWMRKGKKHASECYYGEYVDARDIRRRVRLCADKGASEVMLAELKKQTALERLGVLNPCQAQERRPLLEHLEDYERYLRDRNASAGYVRESIDRIARILVGCGFRRVRDISASALTSYLADLRGQGRGVTTTNTYLRLFKGFVSWMVRDRRTSENPVAHLRRLPPEPHLCRERRALTEDEARLLVAKAEQGPRRFGMTGPHRALAYKFALGTGLRREEMRSLRWSSFDLEGQSPSVAVEASFSKHKRRDVLPLAEPLVDDLLEWKLDHPGDGPVFPLPTRTADMLHSDLKDAGIGYRDGAGRVCDWHALRHTFISMLASGGVHPKVAQTLARHSTISLTMDRYTHLEVLNQHKALEVLPDLGTGQPEEAEVARATGTDGILVGVEPPDQLTHQRTEEPARSRNSRQVPARVAVEAVSVANGVRTPEMAEESGSESWQPQRDLNPCRRLEKPVS
jgi:integrase/recombinase XerD